MDKTVCGISTKSLKLYMLYTATYYDNQSNRPIKTVHCKTLNWIHANRGTASRIETRPCLWLNSRAGMKDWYTVDFYGEECIVRLGEFSHLTDAESFVRGMEEMTLFTFETLFCKNLLTIAMDDGNGGSEIPSMEIHAPLGMDGDVAMESVARVFADFKDTTKSTFTPGCTWGDFLTNMGNIHPAFWEVYGLKLAPCNGYPVQSVDYFADVPGTDKN